MIGLDTNTLVRFLTLDDLKQSEIIKSYFIKSQKENVLFFISNAVILELLYVLESVYDYERDDIVNAIQTLSKVYIFKFENNNLLREFVVTSKKENIELTDLFIGLISKYAGCNTTITFDRKASKSKFFTLLK